MPAAPRITSILCLFQGDPSELGALNLAFSLASRNQALLRVVHISAPPMAVMDPLGAGAYAGAVPSGAVIDQLVRDDNALIHAARTYVTEFAAGYGVRLCLSEQDLAVADGPAVFFVAHEDYAQHLVESYGKMADIIVTMRQDAFTQDSRNLSALLDSGKAVILPPPAVKTSIGHAFRVERMVVAWDGSLQASRALYKALPFTTSVAKLYLLCVREGGAPGPIDRSAAIALLTERHLEPIVIELDAPHNNVGQTLLKAAGDLKADLLVLGAYGHNRLAEMIVGGTSRYVLHHAALPVLMTH